VETLLWEPRVTTLATRETARKIADCDRKLLELAGGPVRRWHVYDHTIAAVTLAGAELAELTIPNRQHS
jgi:hypothetical protein